MTAALSRFRKPARPELQHGRSNQFPGGTLWLVLRSRFPAFVLRLTAASPRPPLSAPSPPPAWSQFGCHCANQAPNSHPYRRTRRLQRHRAFWLTSTECRASTQHRKSLNFRGNRGAGWWRGLDSNQCTLSGQIYSLMDLTTLPPLHSRQARYERGNGSFGGPLRTTGRFMVIGSAPVNTHFAFSTNPQGTTAFGALAAASQRR